MKSELMKMREVYLLHHIALLSEIDELSEFSNDEMEESAELSNDDNSGDTSRMSSSEPTSTQCSWKGFKLVGDNIDRTFRASFQRMDRTTQSFHFFHVYSVLDRIDCSCLSDDPPKQDKIDPLSLLPSEDNYEMLKRDISILISR